MRLIKAVTALLLVVCALAAPAFAEVAVVDVARVIDASAPGKAGQKYVDNLKASLEAELERFVKKTAKDKDAQAKAANKQAELNAQFAAEYDRVTARVMDELRKVVTQWIKTNKKGKIIKTLRSSSELSTGEMTLAIERFRNYSSAQAGIYLPSPNENEFLLHIQQEIEKDKEFLSYGNE